jgi:hypothetical protein
VTTHACVRVCVSATHVALSRVLTGNIVMKMHKIDPKNPARQFYFSIVVIGDKYSGAAAIAPELGNHMHAHTTAVSLRSPMAEGFPGLCSLANMNLPQRSESLLSHSAVWSPLSSLASCSFDPVVLALGGGAALAAC